MVNTKEVINKSEIEDNETIIGEKIAELLRGKVKSVQVKNTVDIVDKNSKEKGTAEIIKHANQRFLIDVLSPEIKENEQKKREHKDALMRAVSKFLTFQFLFVGIMILILFVSFIKCHMDRIPFSDNTMQMCFTFVGVYITSVVVELIAILRCIVTNVFDTSIAGLVEAFREK